MLALFDERFEKLIMNNPDAKKEMDLVQASIVQIGQLVQNSPKVNGNGAKWKQLADRAHPMQVSRWTVTVYQLISHICCNIQGNEGQPSTKQQGIRTGRCFTSRTKQTLKER
jgi:hypothetical protein